MAKITLTVGSNARQYATLAAAWAAIPTDVVASGNSYIIAPFKDSEFVVSSKIVLGGKICDASHGITIRPAAGQGYLDNPNAATNRLAYVPANGVAIRSTGEGTLDITQDWLTIDGLQLSCSYGFSHNVVNIGSGCPNTVFSNPLVEAAPPNNFSGGVSVLSGKVLNPTIILRSASGSGMYVSGASVLVENPTIVRPSNFAATGTAFNYGSDQTTIKNAAVFNFGAFMSNDSPNFVGKNNATDLASIPFGTGNKTGLIYADQFVNTVDGTHDFRLKAGSDLIDAGTAPQGYNLTAPGGNRQQGTSADIGAWEYPNAIQAPTAIITGISVSGTTVTISGTFTGGATSGQATITPTAAVRNNAVAQGPKDVTIGAGTFSVQFTACKVGLYSVALSVANTYYTVAAQNDTGSGFEIEGAKAVTVVQDPMAGQILTIHGTVNGAVSGNLVVPPATVNANGAAQQSVAVTITGTTDPKNFTVSATLGQGGYGAGVLTFMNADGTSLPQAGTFAVTIMGFSGNPDAPAIDATEGGEVPEPTGPMVIVSWAEFDTQAPPLAQVSEVTGVVVLPGVATGYQQFTRVVEGINASQAVTWSCQLGQISTTGMHTPPAPTSVIQSYKVRATSNQNPNFWGEATVTIAALVPGIPSPSNPDTLQIGKLDTTQFINFMQIGTASKRALTFLFEALIDDNQRLREAHNALLAKLDADPGVAAADYAATLAVPDSAVTLGK